MPPSEPKRAGRDVLHQKISSAAVATRSAANRSDTARSGMRCWTAAAGDDPRQGGDSDEGRIAGVDVPVDGLVDRAVGADEHDRGEARAGRLALAVGEPEDQQRDDDGASADAEQAAEEAAAAVPITSSFTKRSRATGGDTSGDEAGDRQRRVSGAPGVGARIAELLAPLRAEPGASAVLCDIDGTLAPIVDGPGGRGGARGDPRRCCASWPRAIGLVACVTGRRALEARWMVGVEELTYSGNHGLELLAPGRAGRRSSTRPSPTARRRARDFVLEPRCRRA